MYKISDLYDLSYTIAADYLRQFTHPWEALPGIKAMVAELGETLGEEYRQVSPQVWVHKDATIAPTAYLGAPCIIGPGTQVRHCAFIRGAALVGAGCVIGNSVELKNVILFDKVQVPHYNYVGDSILGHKAHLGAGAVTSNVKSDKTLVVIHGEQEIPTGIKKVGALIGDDVEVGCNSVLNPGTVIGRSSNVYPLSCVRGVIPENSIYKTGGVIAPKVEGK
ncbi:MAG: UDP-N-acetylglucosamine pyrophosphorylase [Oscillospiraceae bacterium]|nr:UDP-N-acetylglucosamine pyrophosphorylase [Oscillospiraceae bacterium]